jgi:hypothetical protein
MHLDDIKKRFVEEVKLRAYDDKYIDKTEEKEILQIAIKAGITVESARSALVQVCQNNDYVLESAVLTELKELLDTFQAGDGVISHKEFEDSLTTAKKKTKGKRTDQQCKRMIIDIIEENRWHTKQGFFDHWYNAVKKEIGM